MNRPMYVFSGFLDSGKTTSIIFTLNDPMFTDRERTLIICFEEGDVEYNPAFLEKNKCEIEYLDFKDFNLSVLAELDKKHNKPDRIFIELNGMDNDADFLNLDYPGFDIAQIIDIVDASKFNLYRNNMAQFMFNHVSSADVVVLHNYDGLDLKMIRANIKTMNRYCGLCLEDKDGNMSDLRMLSLFDVNNLDISDVDYGLFYMDVIENFKKYDGHKLTFRGFLMEEKKDSKIFGRLAMVCCANDVQRLAIKVTKLTDQLTIGNYYEVTGVLRVVYNEKNQVKIVIEGESAKQIEKPQDEYVNFN